MLPSLHPPSGNTNLNLPNQGFTFLIHVLFFLQMIFYVFSLLLCSSALLASFNSFLKHHLPAGSSIP